ncbi:MAG: hypothetical protein JXA00_00085 [Candidatus Thermoplasmatota archaeon]|nr:hypothetical protein [Candidatus Thermoplasmatota archaeon]
MKKYICGIVALMLLIAGVAIPIGAQNKEYQPVTMDADVPVWELGDTWVYEADYYESGFNGTLVFTLTGDIEYTVVNASGDYYLLEGTGKPLGIIQYNKIGLKTSRFSKAVFQMKIRKSDFGIEDSYYYVKGLCWLTLGSIPLPIPIQLLGEKHTVFTPTTSIIPFPLFDGKTGTIPSINFTENGGTWLFWGVIELSNFSNYWYSGDILYNCTAESVTVPAGTYDVYTVATEIDYPGCNDHYDSCYCEDVGNTVKQSILIHNEFGQVYLSFDLELKSTTYTP